LPHRTSENAHVRAEARDRGLRRVRTATGWITAASTAGAVVLAGGYAQALPGKSTTADSKPGTTSSTGTTGTTGGTSPTRGGAAQAPASVRATSAPATSSAPAPALQAPTQAPTQAPPPTTAATTAQATSGGS
jgi:hypothetical protein